MVKIFVRLLVFIASVFLSFFTIIVLTEYRFFNESDIGQRISIFLPLLTVPAYFLVITYFLKKISGSFTGILETSHPRWDMVIFYIVLTILGGWFTLFLFAKAIFRGCIFC